jgi:ABC-type nitrate/sulfonate/bicarbonate transport system substrate-binding protein
MARFLREGVALLWAMWMALPGSALAAEALKEIRIDWATYNPVSLVLKQKRLLEKQFAKDGINIVWVQSAGSNKALEFLNAGAIDFGSTAGSAALVAKINGNPIKSIYVYSRPEWTALVTTRDAKIATVADLKGKRVAVTRGTDPHILLVRALLGAGLLEKDITVRRVLATYEDARKYALANHDELKRIFVGATKLSESVVDKQLNERTELTHSRIGAPQRESILAAGLALQQAGVIDAKVDVKAGLDALIDDEVPLPTN